MRARSTYALLAILAATACSLGAATTPSASQTPAGDIVIASDLPTALGDPDALRWAIQLAVADHASIGRFKLGYWSLDDSVGDTVSQAKGVQNVRQMIANPRVLGMVGPYNSNVAFAEIPVANAAQLVMLSPSNTEICITLAAGYCDHQPSSLRPTGVNNYFRIAPPESAQGTAMARYVAGLGVRRVAAFSEWPDVGSLAIDSFAAELVRRGGELVLRQDLNEGNADFVEFLTRAKAKGAEAVYAVSGGGTAKICGARAQMKRIFTGGGYFLANDGITRDADCITDAADNAEGMLGTYSDVDPTYGTDATVAKIVAAYRKAYPKATEIPGSVFAAYDCARILIAAITHAVEADGGSFPTRAQVRDEVARTKFQGVTGSYSFNGAGDATSPLMSLWEVKNGKWVFRQQLDASATAA